MGEKLINPLFNVHEKYSKVNVINPYRFGGGTIPSFKDKLIADWEMQEISGTVAAESLGLYDGAISNCTYEADGKIDRALGFNGTSSKIQMLDNDVFTIGSNGMCWEGWYYFNSLPPASTGNRMWLFTKIALSPIHAEWAISLNYYDHGFGKIACSVWRDNGGASKSVTGSTVIATGQWYHIAVVKQDNICGTDVADYPDIYINAVADTKNIIVNPSLTISNTVAKPIIGMTSDGITENWFHGKACQNRIWEALSLEQLEWLYNNNNGRVYSEL